MSFRTIFTPQLPGKKETNQTTFEIRLISKLYRYGLYLIILSFCSLVSMVKFRTAVILKKRNLNWCGSWKFPSDEVTNGFFNGITYVALFKFCWSLIFSDQFISIFYLYCLRFNMIARHTRTHARNTNIRAHPKSPINARTRARKLKEIEFADRSFLRKKWCISEICVFFPELYIEWWKRFPSDLHWKDQ